MYGTPTYRSWDSMIQRCTNPKAQSFSNYGARGITVCERWRSFENFLADMGECPKGLTIDRIDNNGNYEIGNCRWATRLKQMRNRRNTPLVTIAGVTKPLIEWASDLGISYPAAKYRYKTKGAIQA